MPKEPSFPRLRLLIEDESQPVDFEPDTALDRLCLAISALSGWQLRRSPVLPPENVWNRVLVPDEYTREWLCVTSSQAGPSVSVARESVCDFAKDLHELATEINDLRRALAAREAELATAIPVVVDTRTDALKLAQRIEAVLRGGAEAIGCSAAGLYLLDDATEHLKLRCHWNLGAQAFLAPPRPLRSATADVQALAGHAIAIENASECSHWELPMDARSAICVPVASATALLGTLWAFHQQTRSFSDHDTNLWEIIAGRAAAELEREALLRDRLASRRGSATSQTLAVPIDTLDAMQSDCWAATSRVQASDMDRSVIVDMCGSDGKSIQAVAVVAHDDGITGASHAFLSFAQWHQQPHADDFMSAVHNELFQDSTGDSFVSVASIALDHATGQVGLQAAGCVESFIIRPYAWEAWTRPTPPLGDGSATTIGCRQHSILHAADWLLVILGACPRAIRVHDVPIINGEYLAEMLLRFHQSDIEQAADLLWRLIQEHHSAWRRTPSLLLIRRMAEIVQTQPV